MKDQPSNPLWFKFINLLFLLPVIAWPLVFFASIFIFDNPGNFFLALLLFILINSYPLLLVILIFWNAKLFRKNKLIGILFPIVFTLVLGTWFLNKIGGFSTIASMWTQIAADKNDPGESPYNGNYSRQGDTIYYMEAPLYTADAKTFEMINFWWAKDKHCVYYLGSPVSKMDPTTFKDLNGKFSADSFHVYSDTNMVQDVDVRLFMDSINRQSQDN